MADIFESYVRGAQFGQQQRQAREQRNQLAELQSLAPQIMSGNLDATTRGYALDPQAAQAYQQEGNRQQQQLVGLARTLKQSAANPQMQASVYKQAVPFLRRNFGQEIPEEFDSASVMPVVDQILAVAENSPNAGPDLKSLRIGGDGYYYAIQGGQLVNTGVRADARTQLRDQAGVAPSIVDLRTGTASPLRDAQQPVPQQGARGEYRIDPTLPQEVQDGIRAAEAAGVDYGGQTASSPLTATRPDNSQTITPYQQAQLVRQDRADARAEQTALDARDARAQAAQARQAAAQQKAQQAQQAITTRQAALNNVRRGIERVRAALQAVGNTATGSGPIAQYATRYREAGQELETATGAMQNSMLALTRVPGIGSQSDLEAKIANMIYPSLERGESVNANTLRNLEQFYQDLAGTAKQSDNADRNEIQQAGAAPAPRGATAQEGAPRQIQTAEEYNALPSGALFIAPDGTQRRKR